MIVTVERKLQNGDQILIGESVSIQFVFEVPSDSPAPFSESGSEALTGAPDYSNSGQEPSADLDAPSRSRVTMFVAAIAGIVLVGAAVLFAARSFAGSEAEVRILSPETGATIRGPVRIRVEVEQPADIDEVTYLLDGVEFASAGNPPFEATLDPAQLDNRVRNLGSGNHVLTATVQDKRGNKSLQPDTIYLAFDINSGPAGTGTAADSINDKRIDGSSPPAGLPDVASLSRNLAATISGRGWYDFDPQFASEIRKRTADYRTDVMPDASRYRRQIGNAFNSKGLPLAIGFVMAMSESRFREEALDSTSEQKVGLWRVPRQLAVEQGYVLREESSADLKDPKRSAEIAAAYIDDLVNAFGGTESFMYAIACYGKPLSLAAAMRARLEEVDPEGTDRRDFWKMVRVGVIPQDAADRVVRFFAAGIVAENPGTFGLKTTPISALY